MHQIDVTGGESAAKAAPSGSGYFKKEIGIMAENQKLKDANKALAEARKKMAGTEKVIARFEKQKAKEQAAVVAAESKVAKLSAPAQ